MTGSLFAMQKSPKTHARFRLKRSDIWLELQIAWHETVLGWYDSLGCFDAAITKGWEIESLKRMRRPEVKEHLKRRRAS